MFELIIQFLSSALAIVFAGWFLVHFADQIADATKLGKLFVGSILLAGATSLPELSVDLNAVYDQMPDLAVGDLFGSSIFNLLILGIADLMHKGPSKIFTKTSSQHALAAAMSIGLTAIAGMAIFLETHFKFPTVFEVGMGALAILVAYILGIRLIYFNQRVPLETNQESSKTSGRFTLLKPAAGYLISAGIILVAAPFLAEAGGGIAELSGLGKTFIGTTLIALSTSLPELVSTISAVRRGSIDLAIGNIFGSNTFNMILLIPLDMAFPGSLLATVSSVHIFTSFATIFITTVAVMGQLYNVEKHKKFIEPDAFAVIFLVIITLVILYFLPSV